MSVLGLEDCCVILFYSCCVQIDTSHVTKKSWVIRSVRIMHNSLDRFVRIRVGRLLCHSFLFLLCTNRYITCNKKVLSSTDFWAHPCPRLRLIPGLQMKSACQSLVCQMILLQHLFSRSCYFILIWLPFHCVDNFPWTNSWCFLYTVPWFAHQGFILYFYRLLSPCC